MDLLVICTDIEGGLLGHASNYLRQDWRILSNTLTGMVSYNVTTLKIIVTEAKLRRMLRESIGVTELSGFEDTLYKAWAASAIAALGTFPNLVSLTVDVKLHGASRECFWCGLSFALRERFRRITKLRLQSAEEGESARPLGTRCMDHIFQIALKFPSVQPRDFSGPAEIMCRWHEYHRSSAEFKERLRQRMDA